MTTFIPAIRAKLLQDFLKKENLTINSTFSKKKNMVLVSFRDAPYLKQFRLKKKWWKKTNFKSGMEIETKIETEIPANNLVGVYLSDLDNEKRKRIVKI